MKTHFFFKLLLTISLCCAVVETSFAQDPVRHLALKYESQPTGPNQTFYVKLVLLEHDTDVGGYQLLIGFEKAQGSLVAIHNNVGTGGSGSGAQFRLNASESDLDGVAYADTSRQILLETGAPIIPPMDDNVDFDLGRLEFLTSATYSPAQGQFGIYLTDDLRNLGFYDGIIDPIPVETISLDPTAGVADWAMY